MVEIAPNLEADRSAFEAWYKKFSPHASGSATERAWKVWQAAITYCRGGTPHA